MQQGPDLACRRSQNRWFLPSGPVRAVSPIGQRTVYPLSRFSRKPALTRGSGSVTYVSTAGNPSRRGAWFNGPGFDDQGPSVILTHMGTGGVDVAFRSLAPFDIPVRRSLTASDGGRDRLYESSLTWHLSRHHPGRRSDAADFDITNNSAAPLPSVVAAHFVASHNSAVSLKTQPYPP